MNTDIDPITEERCKELLQWFRDRITSAREPQELRKVLKLLEGAETAVWHYREALCSWQLAIHEVLSDATHLTLRDSIEKRAAEIRREALTLLAPYERRDRARLYAEAENDIKTLIKLMTETKA